MRNDDDGSIEWFSLSRAGIDLCLHGKTLIQQTELIWMGCYESWKETTCTHRA